MSNKMGDVIKPFVDGWITTEPKVSKESSPNLKDGGGGTSGGMGSGSDIEKRLNDLERAVRHLPGYIGMITVVALVVSAIVACAGLFLGSTLTGLNASIQRLDTRAENLDARVRNSEQTAAVQQEISRRVGLNLEKIDASLTNLNNELQGRKP